MLYVASKVVELTITPVNDPLPIIEIFFACTFPVGVTVNLAFESPPLVVEPAQNEYVPVPDIPT